MTYREYRYLVLSDLYRISDRLDTATLLNHVLRGSAFKYNFWMRTCAFSRSHPLCRFMVYPFARRMLSHYTYKFGISVPFETSIGSGFYIGHFGGIVVNEKSVIGRNCNISHGVTLGEANRGEKKGCPVLGDNVYVGPGAKIVGAVRIGNDVAIGANYMKYVTGADAVAGSGWFIQLTQPSTGLTQTVRILTGGRVQVPR